MPVILGGNTSIKLVSLTPPAPTVDPDAQAFLTASGITDATITSAINTLVLDLKGYGIWSKMKAIYPFVGGTASTHKWNLKDPQDTNGAFRLTFSGGWTHSANGALPNGTNAFANTFLTPSANQTLTSGHFSYYSRTQGASSTSFGSSGVRNQTTSLGCQLVIRRNSTSTTSFVMWGEGVNDFVSAPNQTDARGFFIGTRISSTSLVYQKNGTTIASITGAQTATSLSNFSYFLAGINQNGALLNTTQDNKECAFASIGDGLLDSEASNLYTAVQNMQTTLNRQV